MVYWKKRYSSVAQPGNCWRPCLAWKCACKSRDHNRIVKDREEGRHVPGKATWFFCSTYLFKHLVTGENGDFFQSHAEALGFLYMVKVHDEAIIRLHVFLVNCSTFVINSQTYKHWFWVSRITQIIYWIEFWSFQIKSIIEPFLYNRN